MNFRGPFHLRGVLLVTSSVVDSREVPLRGLAYSL